MRPEQRLLLTPPRRLALACGIIGPASFVGAWAVAGALRDGYDPISTTISRLAEQGASSRPLMTSGFVAFGLVMPVFGQALGRSLGSRAVTAAVTAAGLTTLGVALTPLSIEGGTTIDTLHAVAAGSGYLAMAVTPALAARALPAGRVAATSYAVSAMSALALIGSLAQPELAGFCQRLGLGVVDAWLATAAVVLLRRTRR